VWRVSRAAHLSIRSTATAEARVAAADPAMATVAASRLTTSRPPIDFAKWLKGSIGTVAAAGIPTVARETPPKCGRRLGRSVAIMG